MNAIFGISDYERHNPQVAALREVLRVESWNEDRFGVLLTY